MRHVRSPGLATPDGKHVRRLVQSGRKRVTPAIVGCLALITLTSPSHAKSFLQTLFEPPKRQTRATAPELPAFLQSLFSVFQHPQHKLRRQPRLRPAIVARRTPNRVPAPGARPPGLKPASLQPDSVSLDEGIPTVLMRDATLRRGDVVVFQDGPRVFRGNGRSPLHQMRDFEDLSASSLVGEQTREEIMARTETVLTDERRLSLTAKPSNGRKP